MTKHDPHPNPTESYATIKLGIDAHAKWYYVARQLDGATCKRRSNSGTGVGIIPVRFGVSLIRE